MTSEYEEYPENGGAPEGTIQNEEQAKEAQEKAEEARAVQQKAADGMQAGAASGQRDAPEGGLRVFIAPQEPNTSFLVRVGKVISFRDPGSPTGKRDTAREGDVKASFHGGILATSDPIVIAWCEAHGPDEDLHKAYHKDRGETARSCRAGHGICCDATDPQAEVWAEFKAAQIPTAGRDATMPPGVDIDGVLQGRQIKGRTGGEGSRLIDAARATQAAHEAVEEDA